MDIEAAFHAVGLDHFLPVALAFHALASALDAAIPQPSPGSHWLPLRKIITILALNFANAANAGQPRIVTWLQRVIILIAAAVPAPADQPPALSSPKPLSPNDVIVIKPVSPAPVDPIAVDPAPVDPIANSQPPAI